jgi:hypothetical protein
MPPGVQKSVRERTLTLPSELLCWELESRWIPECSESDCKGQNLMVWGVLYTIGKLLKLKCLKWARMTHLDIWNTSYGQKKGRESNWQFDSRPLKIRNHPDFLLCRWRATYCWKALEEGHNFFLNVILIEGFHTKLWGPKVMGVPTLAISGLPLGSPRTKSHLDVGFVERHIILYINSLSPSIRLLLISYFFRFLAPSISVFVCYFFTDRVSSPESQPIRVPSPNA